MAVEYRYYIKVGKYYVGFVGANQSPTFVSDIVRAEPFMTESLAKAKARYKKIDKFTIEKLRLK